jgi:hypothetical protein
MNRCARDRGRRCPVRQAGRLGAEEVRQIVEGASYRVPIIEVRGGFRPASPLGLESLTRDPQIAQISADDSRDTAGQRRARNDLNLVSCEQHTTLFPELELRAVARNRCWDEGGLDVTAPCSVSHLRLSAPSFDRLRRASADSWSRTPSQPDRQRGGTSSNTTAERAPTSRPESSSPLAHRSRLGDSRHRLVPGLIAPGTSQVGSALLGAETFGPSIARSLRLATTTATLFSLRRRYASHLFVPVSRGTKSPVLPSAGSEWRIRISVAIEIEQ